MEYFISGLDSGPFQHLYGKDDQYLQRHGAQRLPGNGQPDRIALMDIAIADSAILLNHTYQPARNPYYGTHAIFIREHEMRQGRFINEVPDYLLHRQLSIRAFDSQNMLCAAELIEGIHADKVIQRLLSKAGTTYLHIHSAHFGCYLSNVQRLSDAFGQGVPAHSQPVKAVGEDE